MARITRSKSRQVQVREAGSEMDPNDRLSRLPDTVIHRILGLLPSKEAVRTSVLSKRWERTWASSPALDLHGSTFPRKSHLDTFARRFLLRRDPATAVARLNLRMAYSGGNMKLHIDDWLAAAVLDTVEDFRLRLTSCTVAKIANIYSFPESFSLRLNSLATLKLEGVEWTLRNPSSVALPALTRLSLKKVFALDDAALTKLLAACPSLEELVLKNVVDLKAPTIASRSLRSAEVRPCDAKCATTVVRLETPSLEALAFDRGSSYYNACDLVFVNCEALRFLKISNAGFGDGWLEAAVRRLPALESLTVSRCYLLRNIRIISASLERVVIQKLGNCVEKSAEIVAPKLSFFGYWDEAMMNLSVTCDASFEADIKIHDFNVDGSYNRQWYVNLIAFLSGLRRCNDMTVHVSSEKALIIPNDLRAINPTPLPTLKYLKVRTTKPLFRKRIFRASLGWISPAVETQAIEEKAGYIC